MPYKADIDFFKDNGDGTCTCSVLIKNDADEEIGRVSITEKEPLLDARIKADVKKAYANLVVANDIDPVSRPALGKKVFNLDAQGNMS